MQFCSITINRRFFSPFFFPLFELFSKRTPKGPPVTVKRRKPAWFGQITRHDSLSKTILQGTLVGGRRHGRQRKCWMDNIKEWTSLLMPELLLTASCKKDWKRSSAESSLRSPRRHSRSWGWTELNWVSHLISTSCQAHKVISGRAKHSRKSTHSQNLSSVPNYKLELQAQSTYKHGKSQKRSQRLRSLIKTCDSWSDGKKTTDFF